MVYDLKGSLRNRYAAKTGKNIEVLLDENLVEIGFDDERNEIIVGIVDFFRTYTWDKKLESWVKESGMLGGVKRDPTIISPKMYRRRFRSAIDLYFVMIPDFWTLLHNS
ncbi:hypothetical protein RO3G_14019 [Rhizopus delemar RA 99-880]|uniref:PIPK domain-containing protein n=1 Tax=Rhizopus delemar (strain RA 99-880 / ATCC MYA-4621 / FGSC 9543 / NRRL 43880) TaxID=246409 RepID=I1CLH8_RHIO9|nr:hypothetical protein RO3G_14019 [Rhizopus delemar RA 99-880]|eukprot:EIE89308.1 hypothetical protein RO3G_14019 [Rhizopus delemar RA 99-880]